MHILVALFHYLLFFFLFSPSVSLLSENERPDVGFTDVGGLDIQKQEIREAVELPLTHFDLYKQIGIDPPR